MAYIKEVLRGIKELNSPNEVRAIVVGKDFLYLRKHKDDDPQPSLFIPFDPSLVGSDDPLFFMEERTYGTMEELYLYEGYSYSPVLDSYMEKAQQDKIRLSSLVIGSEGEIDLCASGVDEGASLEDLGYSYSRPLSEFSRIYPLQPEHYSWDLNVGYDYFKGIESLVANMVSVEDSYESEATEKVNDSEEVTEELEVEEEVSSGNEDYNLKDAVDYYAAHIDTVVSDIISNYTKLFKAGYQLKRPVGVLGEQGESGKLMTLSGSTQTFTKPNPVIRALYQLTVAEYDLKILPYRSVDHIASIIVNGVTPDGITVSPDSRLYFPYKMLEFAYGRKTPKATEGGRTNYPKHSDKLNWEAYASEVDENLRQVTTGIVAKILGNFEDVDYFDAKVESSISESLSRFKDVFTTCILVGEFPLIKGLPSLLKVRSLLPYELHNSYNVATEAMRVGISSLGTDPFEGIPIHDGVYHMYTHEYNHSLANSKPMYAYHAAKSLKESGHEVNYKNMIIGLGLDDSILQNGSGSVNLVPNMSHFLVAGSRAGKGVDSMAKLAAALKSGKPVFYLDNKPDIGAVLLDIEPNSFVVNGQLVTSSQDGGTNLSSHFMGNSPLANVNPQGIPSYLYSSSDALFRGRSYSQLGAVFYARALQLVMLITYFRTLDDISARVDLGDKANGIVAFFDEFNVTQDSGLGPLMQKIYFNYARTDYAEAERTAQETGKKNSIRKPSQNAYWGTAFTESLKNTAMMLADGTKAGYMNGEAAASDIYIVGQDLPDVIESAEDFDDFYPTHRGKNTERAQFASGKGGGKTQPLVPLVSPGGADIFVGYNLKHSNYLNQSRGFAKDKLDKDARLFAYIPSYNRGIKKQIESANEEFARNVPTYYKPLLLLADADMDKYFVKNAMSYAIESGIDAESIILDNAQEDEQGNPIKFEKRQFSDNKGHTYTTEYRIHSAVGLKDYLNYIGMDDASISASLRSASDMAQRVVTALGYEGTWREFVQDLRPEYMLHASNVLESLKTGQRLSDLNAKTFSEFREGYPEAFTVADISRLGEEVSEVDVNYEEVDFASLGQSVYFNSEGKSPEDVEELFKQDDLMDDIDLGADYDVYDNAHNVQFSQQDRLKDLTISDIQNLTPDEQKAIYDMLIKGLENQAVIENPNDDQLGYGKLGVAYDNYGRAYKIDISQVDKTSSVYDDVLLDDNMSKLDGDLMEVSYQALVKTVTDKAVAVAKSTGGFKTISVLGGSLIVNDIMIGLRIAENLLGGLPSNVADDIRSGRLASYFNWRLLPRSGVVALKVDSSRFVFNEISEGMGYSKNFNVQELFEDLPRLQKFVVGNEEYTRARVNSIARNQEEDMFYQPRKAEQAYRLSQAWLGRNRISSWQRANDIWKRKDLGTFRKVLGSTGNAALAGASGVTEVTGWAGRKLFRGVGRVANELKSMLDESNNLKKK